MENESDTRPPSHERRGILRYLIGGFLSLWGVGAAALGLSYVRPPSNERRPGERTLRCGPVADLPVGQARFVRHGTTPIYVVRMTESELLAVSAICTHMRCVLERDANSGSFLCPCHAGMFDRNGNVLSGPPVEPLQRYPARVRAGEIEVSL